MIVRRERAADHDTVRAIHAAAFDQGDGDPVETHLLDKLRQCDGWLPALSWVAEIDGRVVAHNVCTRGYVDSNVESGLGDDLGTAVGAGGTAVSCVGLGPIGVEPNLQKTGFGSALMHAMIGAVDALEEPLIALLGDPGYYSRFGFVPSTELGIQPPEAAWGIYFQVLPLTAWDDSIKGQFRYASPFDEI